MSGALTELLLLLSGAARRCCWSLRVELSSGDTPWGALHSCLCLPELGRAEPGATSWAALWSISARMWSTLHAYAVQAEFLTCRALSAADLQRHQQ
jgi:hypothetical protein